MSSASDGAHVTLLASRLGVRVSIEDLDDATVRDNLAALSEQGIGATRVADVPTLSLALAVTPGAPGGPPAREPFDAVVMCSDSVQERAPTGWLQDFRSLAGLPATRAMFVSGAACANFAAGLDVARGLIATAAARSVLLVTGDRVLTGSRYPEISTTVYSDGAASCLVTADPGRAACFRLLGSATENWLPGQDAWGGLADARTVVSAIRAATRRVTSRPVDCFRHLVTPNFGSATRQMFAMAISMPPERLHARLIPEIGHCFAADIPLNLRDLEECGLLSNGDLILAVASSRQTLSVMAFEYVTG